MRCMERNKVRFWYCPYKGKEAVLDEDGYRTGDTRIIYGEAVEVKANISSATGEAQEEVFGNLQDYDKVIVMSDPKFPMDENSVLFVDKEPEYDKEGDPLFDYRVRKVARSLNSVAYAISKGAGGYESHGEAGRPEDGDPDGGGLQEEPEGEVPGVSETTG